MTKRNTVLVVLFFHAILLSAQWEIKNVEPDGIDRLFMIKFFDATNGLAMGTNGLVLKSADEGETWDSLPNSLSGDILDFDYISLDTVLAVNNYDGNQWEGKILKSTDGGQTWDEMYQEEERLLCIEFVNSSRGIVSGENKILLSTDAGDSWFTVYDTEWSGYELGEIRRFDMVDESIGYAIGIGYNSGEFTHFLLKTINGGQCWEEINQLDELAPEEIDFVNEDLGYYADKNNTFKTVDGGMTWDIIDNLVNVVDFSTPSADKVVTVHRPYVVIPDNSNTFAVSTSDDSGASWEGEFQEGAHLESVFFINESVGFLAGNRSIILKTETGGGDFPDDLSWNFVGSSDGETEEAFLDFYPNPAIDKIYLEAINNDLTWTYSIKNASGITVREGSVIDAQIDVSDLSSGIFIVTIQSDNERRTAKFIKP